MRRYSLPICWCLLLLLSACATPPDRTPKWRPDPPPAALAAPCDEGPAYPDGAVRLADLMEIKRQREAAAADCRARQQALVRAWPS